MISLGFLGFFFYSVASPKSAPPLSFFIRPLTDELQITNETETEAGPCELTITGGYRLTTGDERRLMPHVQQSFGWEEFYLGGHHLKPGGPKLDGMSKALWSLGTSPLPDLMPYNEAVARARQGVTIVCGNQSVSYANR